MTAAGATVDGPAHRVGGGPVVVAVTDRDGKVLVGCLGPMRTDALPRSASRGHLLCEL